MPIFTNTECPEDATLVSETAIAVPRDPPATGAKPSAPAVAVANANATVINQGVGYGIPSRQFRRDVDRERAWDRCERAKVRAESELAALRLKRKMSDIRRWENYAEDECAAYEIMTR